MLLLVDLDGDTRAIVMDGDFVLLGVDGDFDEVHGGVVDLLGVGSISIMVQSRFNMHIPCGRRRSLGFRRISCKIQVHK